MKIKLTTICPMIDSHAVKVETINYKRYIVKENNCNPCIRYFGFRGIVIKGRKFIRFYCPYLEVNMQDLKYFIIDEEKRNKIIKEHLMKRLLT